jgi:ribosomal protein S18 acetylase RimI-like enzyme
MLTSSGYASLFIQLVAALHVSQRWQRHKGVRHGLFVVEAKKESVGFLHCIHSRSQEGVALVHINGCAIAPAHRNMGYGKQMIQWLLARESNETLITAHCNRYAKAMQHIFKRHRFVRRSIGNGVDCYVMPLRTTPAPRDMFTQRQVKPDLVSHHATA